MSRSQKTEYDDTKRYAHLFRDHFKMLTKENQKKLVKEICEEEGKSWLAEQFLRFVLKSKR